MTQTSNVKWILFAVIAGFTALITSPRVVDLPRLFDYLADAGLLGIVYSGPLAALVCVGGLVTAAIGASRRNLRIAAIGFFISLVWILYLVLSWLAWGIEFGRWGFFPLVGMFDYDFADFDIWTWHYYFHYNFALFLFAAMGFVVFRLWSELRTPAETGNLASQEGSTAMPAQTNFCPTCGEKTTPGGSFCPKCGASLSLGASNPTAKYNTLAIVAFVISWFVPIVGFFLAYAARREIRASGGTQKGDGFVLGALILNWVWVGSLLVIFLFLAAAS